MSLKVIIIGFPFDPIVLEQEDDIGGTFRYRSYEQLICFSDYRLPMSHPDHMSLENYLDYLRAYAQHFQLSERIKLNCKVIDVNRDRISGEHDTKLKTARYLAICSGKPVFHSHEYKTRSQLADKRVMILGTGDRYDLAYEAAKARAKEVVLCTRGGFLSIPHALNNFEIFGMKFDAEKKVAVDSLITTLSETAYVHPWIASSHIRWFISDFVIEYVLWFLTGTQAGRNQWVGQLEPERLGRAYVFLNKSHKAMPYLNRPYRDRLAFLDHIARYIDPPENSPPQTDYVVDLAPFPLISFLTVEPSSLTFRNDVRLEVVIYTTGYTQEFAFLDKDSGYATPEGANIRNIAREGDESVGFIRFVRPGVGAIPPIAEMQTFWISLIKGQVRRPLPPPHYHLLVEDTARIKYGVDHSTYMSTPAKDIGAAPGLWQLWRLYGTHVLVCYCFGAAFTSFYRLVDTIMRRGIVGNMIMRVIPMAFYLTLNALAFEAGLAYCLCGDASNKYIILPFHFISGMTKLC
ncbi:uncharacterized protein BT62DRAFT_977351 [Guyanagaster necrorhizus]|uniref:Dimethylaniline monooxygenase n=1 Tax=Guyanagaster necrorhizus TaxID=856835 RepID=A0A9P8AYS0_9AGAR|nr:uncharacterized protein BT62DRAFT_977351 [Guyanagaster necrorhizus MCA 3950]KAG7452795.1 hypothetical protein BT62DRAFT_977351 [Guyanagaster necrorhizus MCA 3950]